MDELKKTISDLEIDCRKKSELIDSIDVLRDDLTEAIDEIKKKGEEYDKLLTELKDMKNVMDQVVFKKKWRLIRFLLR